MIKKIGILLALCILVTNSYADSITRTTAYTYDTTTRLLKTSTIEPTIGQLQVQNNYQYDNFGNQVVTSLSSVATGSATISPRATSTTYDASGRFVLSKVNELNQSTQFSFDPAFGVQTGVTDINKQTTNWKYDDFGRKVQELRADGTKTTFDYIYCTGTSNGSASCPVRGSYIIQSTPFDASGKQFGSWVKNYYDVLNREIRNETQGFDGTSIYTDTVYDEKGHPTMVSRPYFAGQNPQWIIKRFDVLDRIVDTMTPDGGHTLHDYNGLLTTITNPLNQTQIRQRDALGREVSITDNLKNTIIFHYDGFGNLVQSVDSKGNTVQLTYDVRGNKIQMQDPDMGVWNYVRDALGELIKQVDAKNQETKFEYDTTGRLITRSEPDLISKWEYDTCTNGVGKLCITTSSNGYRMAQTYDGLGRPNTKSITVDTTYVSNSTYDPISGRLITQTYPQGLSVRYNYNQLGYLQSVANNSSGNNYWSANQMNAEGQLLVQTYGNGIVSNRTYDSYTGSLKQIITGLGLGDSRVQNIAFEYDALGSMGARKDANQKLEEYFSYDGINRLINSMLNSTGAGLIMQTYGYDDIGNITSRSSLGNYTYGGVNMQPHMVKTVSLPNGGTLNYQYDQNGNQISELFKDNSGFAIPNTGRNETYTSFNMPNMISSSSGNVIFQYGPEHQRIKQINKKSTIVYLNPDLVGGLLYEKETSASGNIEHRNFITANGQVIALVKQLSSGAVSTTYLHRDNLGSTTAVTDEIGQVKELLSYEPFGKRRFNSGSTDPNNTLFGQTTARGYTNHEHLEDLELINMNGRIYDPIIGRFISADPNVPHMTDLQSFNRYSYVRNSPMTNDDPSGFFDHGPADNTMAELFPNSYTSFVQLDYRAKLFDSRVNIYLNSQNGNALDSSRTDNSYGFQCAGGVCPAEATNTGSGTGAKLIRDCASEACVVNGVRYKSNLDIPGNEPVPLIGADGKRVLDSAGQPMNGPSRANLDKVTESLKADIGNATKFRQGGDWDFQRVKDDSGNYIFTKQYREFANVAIGYAFAGKGIGWWETAAVADIYAWKNSTFGRESMDSVFRHLPSALTYDYAAGANLWVKNANIKNPSTESSNLGQ